MYVCMYVCMSVYNQKRGNLIGDSHVVSVYVKSSVSSDKSEGITVVFSVVDKLFVQSVLIVCVFVSFLFLEWYLCGNARFRFIQPGLGV